MLRQTARYRRRAAADRRDPLDARIAARSPVPEARGATAPDCVPPRRLPMPTRSPAAQSPTCNRHSSIWNRQYTAAMLRLSFDVITTELERVLVGLGFTPIRAAQCARLF